MRLYLDDIDDLVALLQDQCDVVRIRAGRAEASSAEDLRDATRDELRWLSITGSNPYVSIELTP